MDTGRPFRIKKKTERFSEGKNYGGLSIRG